LYYSTSLHSITIAEECTMVQQLWWTSVDLQVSGNFLFRPQETNKSVSEGLVILPAR
jgi:hypothetical protein